MILFDKLILLPKHLWSEQLTTRRSKWSSSTLQEQKYPWPSRRNSWRKVFTLVTVANPELNSGEKENKELVENVKEWRLTSFYLSTFRPMKTTTITPAPSSILPTSLFPSSRKSTCTTTTSNRLRRCARCGCLPWPCSSSVCRGLFSLQPPEQSSKPQEGPMASTHHPWNT